MDMKEQYKIFRMRAAILILCGVIPCAIMTRKAFPTKDSSAVTPTEIPAETKELWSRYKQIFPKEYMVRTGLENSDRLFEARFEMPRDEWERAKNRLKEREWKQTAATSSRLEQEYAGELISQEESKRPLDLWLLVRYTDEPDSCRVDEHIWAIQGEDRNSVIVLYLIRKN